MLTTDDVGNLFASMRTAYGPQWKHGKGAISVWRNALSRYTERDVMSAANRALELHVKHPPTLPEFVQVKLSKVESNESRISILELADTKARERSDRRSFVVLLIAVCAAVAMFGLWLGASIAKGGAS